MTRLVRAQRVEKAEGIAFARAWRERRRGTDWAHRVDGCLCPLCTLRPS